MMKRLAVATGVTAAGLTLAGAAGAHVTVNPSEVAAGSFARLTVRVPTERPDAATVRITVRLPEGLEFVSFQPKPGWTRSTERVGERITTVTWSGGRVEPGEFEEFGLSARVPDDPGRVLVFPALQRYSSGEVVRWIGPPSAEEPASRVTISAPEDETATAPETAPASSEEDEGRANLALGFGIAGFLAGLAALGVAVARTARR